MTIWGHLGAAVAALLSPTQVGGQAPASQAPARAAPAQPAPASLAELQTGATCILAAAPNAADALLASAPFSTAERAEATGLAARIQSCLHRPALAATAYQLRGTFAELLLEARFPRPQAARSPALGVAPLLRPELANARPDAARLAPLFALARCTSLRSPDLVRAFLAAAPGTPAAGVAFTALGPAMNACANGQRIGVFPPDLRGLLAEQLYRWSVVQRDGPGSPWAAAATPAPAPPQAH